MVGLLFPLLLPVLILASESKLPSPTHAGRLPAGVDKGFAARLDSAGSQYLLASRGGMLVAFAFEHGDFLPRCSLPLPARMRTEYGSPSTEKIAAAGDVDRDGLDEIVVAGSRTIRRYELVRGAFALTAEARVGPTPDAPPALCFDVCIGDVNQDSTNEVLLSGVESLAPLDDGASTRFYACQWTDRRLALLWDDGGVLDLEGPSWIMPIAKMAGVWDPANLGTPGLLMERGKSDVRASTFDELTWTPNGLCVDGDFVIRDRRIQWNVPSSNPAGSAVRCDFAHVGGMTAVLASMHGEEDPWQGEYFVFSGDSATEHRVLWSDDDFDWWSPSAGIIIDLDSRGPGALRFMYPRPDGGGPRFEFYRL